MRFSFAVTILAIAIVITCFQEISAAPTKNNARLNKHRAARIIRKRAPQAPTAYPPPPASPPVCPDPKDPRCPPAPAAVPPATAAPPTGLAIPGVTPPVFPDLTTSTAGLGTAPVLPDPIGMVNDVVTGQATSAAAIVPGLLGSVQGFTNLGAAGQQDD